jgi:hypothetical protein
VLNDAFGEQAQSNGEVHLAGVPQNPGMDGGGYYGSCRCRNASYFRAIDSRRPQPKRLISPLYAQGTNTKVCFDHPSSYLKATLTRGEKYGRSRLNRARPVNNEHQDNSYHCSPYTPIWRWRRLLVFATQVKRKSLPGAHGLHSEPMGDGLRLRFRKYQSDFKHLLIQSGAGVALLSDSGTRGPNDDPHSHQRFIRLRRKTRSNRSAGIPDRGAFPRTCRCSRRDRLGNKTGWEHQVSVRLALERSVCAQRHRVLTPRVSLRARTGSVRTVLTEAQRRWVPRFRRDRQERLCPRRSLR